MSDQLSDEAKKELDFLNTAVNENKDTGPVRFAIFGQLLPDEILNVSSVLEDTMLNLKDHAETVRGVVVFSDGTVLNLQSND